MGNKIVLSKRLAAVAAYVTRGNRVCDVGCDHGFIPIYLVQQGISPYVLAMDVRKGPLMQAQTHIEECGLTQYIETRLSDGLDACLIGESDTLICAGMGGRLMMHILRDCPEKTASFRELILQPQSEIKEFRRFLREQGYLITDENMIEEDGKFYPMMRVVTRENIETVPLGESFAPGYDLNTFEYDLYGSEYDSGDSEDAVNLQDLEDLYGPLLIRERHPALRLYLEREDRIYGQILEGLQAKGLEDVRRKERYAEIEKLRQDCRRVLIEIE